MKNLILFLALSLNCLGASLDTNFVAAIHQIESSGRLGAVLGDNGKALGPLQIRKACWQDAIAFDPSIGGTYSDCASLPYATKVMTAYLTRYAKNAIMSNDYEKLARTWNGGPNGASKSGTNAYWNKVRRRLQ